jgi:hypothetical protein
MADETGQLAGSVGDDVLRGVQAVGDDAVRQATHDEIARLAASQATIFAWQVEQGTPGRLTAEHRMQLQAGLEKAVCLYLKRSTLAGQEDVEQGVAEIAARVGAPYQDLLNGAVSAAQSIRLGLADRQEFVGAVESQLAASCVPITVWTMKLLLQNASGSVQGRENLSRASPQPGVQWG